MPTVFLTATAPAGVTSPVFFNDADGLECVVFTGIAPTTITVFNLTGGFPNWSTNWRNLACGVTQTDGQFTIGPTDGVVRAVPGPPTVGFGLVAHNISGPATLRARVEYGQVGPVVPCGFGTRPKPSTPPSWVWDAARIGALFPFPIDAGVVALMAGFFGTAEFANLLCASLPPQSPDLSQVAYGRPEETLRAFLVAHAWPVFCECVPGTPAPTPPDPPTTLLPPNLPVRDLPSCSQTDLCGAIIALLKEVHALETTVGYMQAYLTTLQRHGVPFASVRGPVHTGLTGSGSLGVERIIGLQAAVTAKPSNLQEFLGAPAYISDLGWLSALTGDGLVDEIRLTRDIQAWASKILPYASSVGWALRPGVEITLTELLAEP